MATSRNKKVNVNFAPVIVMLCLSVGCGYMAAKYVVQPVVNYVPQITETSDKAKSSTKIIEEEIEIESAENVTGYALQYGCYSGKASAEAAMKNMNIDGAQIIEQNNMFKIIGELYKTKDEAKSALNQLPDKTEAFVTEIYE
jgi:cell division protein FtsN